MWSGSNTQASITNGWATRSVPKIHSDSRCHGASHALSVPHAPVTADIHEPLHDPWEKEMLEIDDLQHEWHDDQTLVPADPRHHGFANLVRTERANQQPGDPGDAFIAAWIVFPIWRRHLSTFIEGLQRYPSRRDPSAVLRKNRAPPIALRCRQWHRARQRVTRQS
jgi:hypothetical protein